MSRHLVLAALVQLCGMSALGAADTAEDKVIEQLLKHKARITRDERLPGKPVIGVDLRPFFFERELALKSLTALPRLQTLTLGNWPVTDAELKELGGLTQLQSLDLSHSSLRDSALKQVGRLKGLRALNLAKNSITDAGLKEIAGLERLRELNLARTEITDTGIKELSGMMELRTLNLESTKITDAGIKELTRMKELRSLKLVWTGITDAGTKDLAALQKLQLLDLWGTKITPDGVKELLPLTNLRDLGLPDMSEGENALRELTAFQHLHRLRLSLRWEEENLRQLAAIKSLREVNGGSITDETLAALRRVPVWHVFGCAKSSGDPSANDPKRPTGVDEILSLDLSRDRISDRGLKELTVLKNLRALLLDGSHITAAGLKELASLKHLHTLGLAYNEDGPNCDTLKGLTALPSLRTLHLPGRDLDLPPEGCIDEALQTLRALNLLHLFDRATGPNGERVSGAEKVVALDLRDLRVTDDCLKALAVLKNLQTLRLGGTKVTAAGLKALAPLRNLRLLDFGESHETWGQELAISDEVLQSLHTAGLLHALSRATAAGGKRPTTADDVVAFELLCDPPLHVDVTDIGLGLLTTFRNLQTLSLPRSRVTDVGVKELIGLRKLRQLDLTGTHMTDASLKEIATLKDLETLAPAFYSAPVRTLQALREQGLLHRLDRAKGMDGQRPARLEEITSLDLGGLHNLGKAGLREVARLPNLRSLDLNSTFVADSDLKELAGLRHLETLMLSVTRVTNRGLKELASLQNLRTLDLRYSKVSDEGLKELAALKNLRSLHLGYSYFHGWGISMIGMTSAISDEGLKSLAALKSLRILSLEGTGATAAGIAALQKALPQVAINGGDAPGLNIILP